MLFLRGYAWVFCGIEHWDLIVTEVMLTYVDLQLIKETILTSCPSDFCWIINGV
jgi:hypothetical protein